MPMKGTEWAIFYQGGKELVPCIRFDSREDASEFLDDIFRLYTEKWNIEFDKNEFWIEPIIPVPQYGMHVK